MKQAGLARCLARSAALAPMVLGLAVLTLVLLTFRDYGITWDEPSSRNYATSVLRWYETRGADQSAVTGSMRHYGPLFEIVATWFERALPFGTYDSRHLATALVGVVGVLATLAIGTITGGRVTGLVAGLLLLVTPAYYGHMYANPKDVPLAALYAVALATILRWFQRWATTPWAHTAAIGVAIGLAAAIRIGAIVLLTTTLLAAMGIRLVTIRRRDRPSLRRVAVLLAPPLAAPAIAWVVMSACWPFAAVSPVLHPAAALRSFSSFSWTGRVLLGGRLVDAHALPWDYLPRWFAVTMPDIALVACGLLVVLAACGGLRPVSRWWTGELAIILMASFGPLAALILMRPTLYDGLRHVLFILPPLAVVLARLLVAAIVPLRRAVRLVVIVALAIALAVTVVDMVRLHPYQYVYFNRLVAGGLRGAAGRYDTDYWGASLREATEWVVRNIRPKEGRTLRVGNLCSEDLSGYVIQTAPGATDRFVSVAVADVDRGAVDIHVAIPRDGRQRRLPGTTLHRVERDGATLAYVIAVTHPEPPTLP